MALYYLSKLRWCPQSSGRVSVYGRNNGRALAYKISKISKKTTALNSSIWSSLERSKSRCMVLPYHKTAWKVLARL